MDAKELISRLISAAETSGIGAEALAAKSPAEIAQLKQEADNKDREISELKGVCNERESLIITQDQHIKRFQGILVEHEAAFAARESGVWVEVRVVGGSNSSWSLPCMAVFMYSSQVDSGNVEPKKCRPRSSVPWGPLTYITAVVTWRV